MGNYGNSWWKQVGEFESFHGPVLFTTNCNVPPKSEEVRARIFTTGSSGFPGCTLIVVGANGKKDFSAIIEMAKTLPAPEEIETGSITGGFAHAGVFWRNIQMNRFRYATCHHTAPDDTILAFVNTFSFFHPNGFITGNHWFPFYTHSTVYKHERFEFSITVRANAQRCLQGGHLAIFVCTVDT